jgi:hypothetical protein
MTSKSKLSRFLHLERARAERAEAAPPLQSGGRFESPQERTEHQEAAIPEVHLERFKGQAPLALADLPEEARRFPRCALCGSENGRFAQACGVCGADLGTPEQLEFNERLWQERRKELSRTREDELEALRQHEARRREAEAQVSRQFEQLRATEGSPRWLRAYAQHTSLGMALLSLLPHPLARGLTLAAAGCLVLGLWRYGQGWTRLAAMALVSLLLILFVPGKPARKR